MHDERGASAPRSRGRRWVAVAAVATVAGLGHWGCSDKKDWAEERQRAADEEKSQRKKELEEKERRGASPAAVEKEPTDPFWDGPHIRVPNEGDCPTNLWALFPEEIPGGQDAARKANKARQPELAKELKAATFMAKLRAPAEVKLLEYDAAKGEFPIEIIGLVDCQDSIGHLGVAFGPAKAVVPGNSAAQQGAQVQQAIWEVTPLRFTIPMKSMSEAREFKERQRFGLEGRLVFHVDGTELNRRMIRIGKQAEDWGAGRLIRAKVTAVRITADRGKRVLLEQKDVR